MGEERARRLRRAAVLRSAAAYLYPQEPNYITAALEADFERAEEAYGANCLRTTCPPRMRRANR